MPALAIAQDAGAGRDHVADGVQRLLGFAFLNETDHRIDDHHGDDDDGVDKMTQQEGRHCGHQQEVDQRIVELRQETQQRGTPCGGGQFVRPMGCKALSRHAAGKALPGRAQCFQDGILRQAMPRSFGSSRTGHGMLLPACPVKCSVQLRQPIPSARSL